MDNVRHLYHPIYPLQTGINIYGLAIPVMAIRVRFVGVVAMLSVSVFDLTNLEGERKAILKAAEKGVTAATHEGVEWIKDDVIQGEEYVGTRFYPDVKASTKRAKARKGRDTVLVDTTNTLSSFDGEVNGLEGKITGGGKDYHTKLFSRWRIGDLYMAMHMKESQDIIKKSIEKAI